MRGDVEGIVGEMFLGKVTLLNVFLNNRLFGRCSGVLPWWFHTLLSKW